MTATTLTRAMRSELCSRVNTLLDRRVAHLHWPVGPEAIERLITAPALSARIRELAKETTGIVGLQHYASFKLTLPLGNFPWFKPRNPNLTDWEIGIHYSTYASGRNCGAMALHQQFASYYDPRARNITFNATPEALPSYSPELRETIEQMVQYVRDRARLDVENARAKDWFKDRVDRFTTVPQLQEHWPTVAQLMTGDGQQRLRQAQHVRNRKGSPLRADDAAKQQAFDMLVAMALMLPKEAEPPPHGVAALHDLPGV